MPKKKSTKYIDGFVLVVPKSKTAAYRKIAKEAGKMWIKYGALEYVECIGDDLKPNTGGHPMLFFSKLVKLKPGEQVWFSYIVYKSKQHRNQVNAKVMKDMEEYQKDNPDHMKAMPFDMKRLSWGGFKAEVDLSK